MTYLATAKQLEYVETLRTRLHLSPDWFIGYCMATYGSEPAGMTVPVCSALLDEMVGWAESPAALMRAQGQQELFGGAL